MVDLLNRMRKNILVMDSKRFDKLTKTDSVAPSASYLGVCLIFAFLLMSLSFFYIFSQFDSSDLYDDLALALEESAWNMLDVLIVFVVFVVVIHFTARILGAKKSIRKTWQVHAYAYTPSFLLGWIYIFASKDYFVGIVFEEVFGNDLQGVMLLGGFVFSLLAVINGITGLRRIHGLSLIKAIIAEFLIPLAAYVGIIVAYMIALDSGMVPMP